jgi:hypothetical protein
MDRSYHAGRVVCAVVVVDANVGVVPDVGVEGRG